MLALEGVAEVYSVDGEWDLVAIVRAKDNGQLAEVITKHMLKLGGLLKTTTLIGFRGYSKYDLERMFSIGLEQG